MDDSNGWIKLYRRLTEKAIWTCSTPEHCKILITLLMMANHEEKQWIWQGKKFEASPGQFVTSLSSIKKKCGKGISTQNIRSALDKFKKLEFLTCEATKTGRLITIVNWQVYQSKDNCTNKDSNKEVTKSQQTSNKEPTTNKNDKNYKNDKKKDIIGDFTSNLGLIEAINSFIEMRKKLKKPMTDHALELMLKKLNKFSSDDAIKIEIINQSILGGWTDIYELKQQKLPFTNSNWKDWKDFDKPQPDPDCPECHGTGKVELTTDDGNGTPMTITKTCECVKRKEK
jgi:DNA replication protein DnaD